MGVAGHVLVAVVVCGVLSAAEYGAGYLWHLGHHSLAGLIGGAVVPALACWYAMWSARGAAVGTALLLVCASVLLTVLSGAALDQRTLDGRGRVEQVVVAAQRVVDPGGDPPQPPYEVVTLTDLSGRPVPGVLAHDGLHVGERITVTVDPKGAVAPVYGAHVHGAGEVWAWAVAVLLVQLAVVLSSAVRRALRGGRDAAARGSLVLE